jgi:hypothetical protein
MSLFAKISRGGLRAVTAASVLTFGLLLAAPGAASAGTFSNNYSGSDETFGGVTALNYSSGHATFTLRLNVDGVGANEAYSINMYDRNGARVWGAGVNGRSLLSGRAADQTYTIGSNVTRISIDPNSSWSLVKWSRA